jgi:hypothetical protein
MTPLRLLVTAIEPALIELATGGIADSPPARRFLLAIALQESRLLRRRQVGSDGAEDGPAASFWQFEKSGGCRGVLRHKVSAPHMRYICALYSVEPTEQALWEAMRYQDIVAAAAGRLLILTLPSALPTTPEQGWAQYLSAWRPGKPHPETWAGHWATAENTVRRKS